MSQYKKSSGKEANSKKITRAQPRSVALLV